MKPQKLSTRLLSMIMSVLMIFGTVPGTGLAALAADEDDTDITEVTDVTENEDSTYERSTLSDALISALEIDIPGEEYNDDTDAGEYDVWIGDVRITDENKNDVLGDGKVSFDPAANVLTLNNAVLDKASTSENKSISKCPSTGCNICLTQDLTIKGSATLSNGKNGIAAATFFKSLKLTIDCDLDIDAESSGISATFASLNITGGNINIKTGENSIGIGAIYSPELNISGGNIKISGQPMLGLYTYNNLHISDCTIETSGSGFAVGLDDLNGVADIALPLMITEPEGGIFRTVPVQSGDRTVNCLAITDASGNTAKSVKISPVTDKELCRVTFDTQGHAFVNAQNLVKGGKALKPDDPTETGFTFEGWYTEKDCKNEYNFDTIVNNDITIYAKWSGGVVGSGSALDPVSTTLPGDDAVVYLIKGQKYNIGKGWYIDKNDKDSNKVLSLSKKGDLKVKNEGDAVIKCGSDGDVLEVKIHATAFKLENKTVKIKIEESGKTYTEQLKLTGFDEEHYSVFWYSSNPDVVSVNDSGLISTAGNKGTSKVTAYVNGCAFTWSVSVKEKVSSGSRTIHMVKGSSKTINIKGDKKTEWKAAPEGVVTIKKNKIKAGDTAGITTLTTHSEKLSKDFTATVYVEDLTLTDNDGLLKSEKKANTYSLELKAGGSAKIMPSGLLYQTLIFKSNKSDTAFIDEAGNVYARKAGKCKFTAKINGKTITINVNVTE